MQPKRQAGIIFIFITLFIDILGIGIIIPVLPELIKTFVVEEYAALPQSELEALAGTSEAGTSESSAVQEQPAKTLLERAVDSRTGYYFGILSALYAAMQFVFAPILGALSDRFGRRPVILLSLLGLGIDYLILAFSPSLAWLFVGRIIAGIMGASFTAANAYIADISTAENRAKNFGFVGIAFGLGFIFGPVLGGLLGQVNVHLPFFVSAGLVFLNLLYGFFVLPESLKPENRSAFSWGKANPVSSLLNLRKYPLVFGLSGAFLFLVLAQGGLQNVWVLYTSNRFGWGELANGLSLGLVGITAAIVQGGLVGPVIKRLGERGAIIMGLSVSAVTFLCYGLASQGWIMLTVIVLGAIAGVAQPAIQGLVAGSVQANEQGAVQGALTSLFSLASVFAPLIFVTGLFSYFTSANAPFVLPGAPFFLGALFNLFAVIIVSQVFRRFPPTQNAEAAPAQVSGGMH
jgi:MFS transporter, DHA1 family, tetracycline resistance protein